MTPEITLSQALSDPSLFGGTFGTPSFWTWRTVARLIDGIPLTEPREVDLYKQCSGRSQLPNGPVRRLFVLAGLARTDSSPRLRCGDPRCALTGASCRAPAKARL